MGNATLAADDPSTGHPDVAWSLRDRLGAAEPAAETSVAADALDGLVVSPELVLVCPELRAVVLAQLPDRDPDGFLPQRSPAELRMVAAPGPFVEATTAPERRPPAVRMLAVAALAHTLAQSVVTALTGAVVFAGLTGIVLLTATLH